MPIQVAKTDETFVGVPLPPPSPVKSQCELFCASSLCFVGYLLYVSLKLRPFYLFPLSSQERLEEIVVRRAVHSGFWFAEKSCRPFD